MTDDKTRIEHCDKEAAGLYVECRNGNKSPPTYYGRSKDADGKTKHTRLGRVTDFCQALGVPPRLKSKPTAGRAWPSACNCWPEVPTRNRIGWRSS